MTAEQIYEEFKLPDRDKASIGRLLSELNTRGLRKEDPRLRAMISRLRQLDDEFYHGGSESDRQHLCLRRHHFIECVAPCTSLLSSALRDQLVIPRFSEFTNKITELFEECRSIDDGVLATYIPQLARQDPNAWGLSLCTIDGQRFSLGDARTPFCLQSVSKAFTYAIVSSDIGADTIHKFVGHEPSGRPFNEIRINNDGKPHTPMINSGAIITTSLLKTGLPLADRFDFVFNQYRRIAGGEFVGFSTPTFLSERVTADRNFALAHYMRENGCFPVGIRSLREELDLYFQLCSVETNCEGGAVMTATLANGGLCPLTDEICIHPLPCRDTLTLMYSCGMYDYSGEFAFLVGLPAKSGVSGALILVVPNLMGMCLWSPLLYKTKQGVVGGNSTRGVHFCQKLISTFNFHSYDSLLHADQKKIDPRLRT
ncbi:glutaminase DH11.1 [Aphelenchoides avenae]|nr:glutaminase DH11.1 [Aphelenchus avenae]